MTSGFNEKDLMTCVHCGLCLNACPTYLETGNEADSPRGRILLMRAAHEGQVSMSDPDVRRHIDLCLGCRACEVACPSGVPYGDLLEVARQQTNQTRPWLQRNARKALLMSLTNSEIAKQSVWLSGVTGGLPSFASKLLQGDPSESEIPMKLPAPAVTPELPSVVPSVGKRRARVALLTGCVMKALYSDVHWDTIKVLAANGCEVLIRPNQGCCGALHLHQGFGDQAIELASSLVDRFGAISGIDAIIVNSAGCGSTIKEYSKLLANAPNAANAATFGAKCKDVTEFLDELGWVADLNPLPLTVTYHDACHLAMAQRITAPPRKLLAKIPQINLVDLEEGDVCCGSAGVYNITEPSMARRLQRRKVQRILDTGATVVATGNPGCMAWICDGLDQKNIRVVHPVTLLREALK